jgi:hypothetical protein
MTQEEKIKMEVATCRICSLATIMKACKACRFNHALKIDTVSTQKENE